VPSLRFPEFSGEWESYKLSDIADRVTRRNKNLETQLPLTISAQYGLIDQETFFNKKVASIDLSNYYLLQKGEFAYNRSYSGEYPWGAIKRLDLYDKGALSSLYICFKPKTIFHSDFAVHYFQSSKWHKGVSDIAGEGARNHGLLNVSVLDYFNTKHYVPDAEEQDKIARFLNLIDERISIQSRIIEDLKKLRSAIIEKLLLPQKDWKSYRLRDVGTYLRGLTYSSNDIIDGNDGCIVLRSNNISDGNLVNYESDIVRVNLEISPELYLQNGDIIICMANGSNQLVGKKSVYYCEDTKRITVGAFCGIYRTDVPIVKWLMLTNQYSKFVKQSIQGGNGAIANLNPDDILNMKFFLPPKSTIIEYSNLFSLIDKKIRLEMAFLDSIKYQKNFFLQKLFI